MEGGGGGAGDDGSARAPPGLAEDRVVTAPSEPFEMVPYARATDPGIPVVATCAADLKYLKTADDPTEATALLGVDSSAASHGNRTALLLGAYAVFFFRYIVATFLSAFFGLYATDRGISPSMQGLIFAVFPIGITVTALVAPTLILQIGTRAAVTAGLIGTGVLTIALGFVPDASHQGGWDSRSEASAFAILYFLNGFIGGLAETGTTIVLTNKFADKLGVVTSSIGTVCGLGCLAGPPLGGLLYKLPRAIPGSSPLWDFRAPFLAVGIAVLLLSIFTSMKFCNVELKRPAKVKTKKMNGGGSMCGFGAYGRLLTPMRCVTACAIALSGAVVASLDPTLANRLGSEQYNMGAAQIGAVFMASSMAYIVVSIPVGWAVDAAITAESTAKRASRICKAIQAAGFSVLFLAFALLGPLSQFSGTVKDRLEHVGIVWVAMILKGIGSAGNNAGYPDLSIGVPSDDTNLQATLSGIWNAAYAVGWALGPLAGGILVEHIEWGGFCTTVAYISGAATVALLLCGLLGSPTFLPRIVRARADILVGFGPPLAADPARTKRFTNSILELIRGDSLNASMSQVSCNN